MSQSRVYAVDLLKRLHAALARFGVDAQTALGAAALAIGRAFDMLEDRRKYWVQQVNRRQEEVSRARGDLIHARALHRGQSVGCVEQELALRKARQSLEQAEAKVVAVRRWQVALPDAVKDFEALARGLSGRLDADLRQSLALLEGKIGALEAYLALSPTVPEDLQPPAPPERPQNEEAP
jgi:hypothetical protein